MRAALATAARLTLPLALLAMVAGCGRHAQEAEEAAPPTGALATVVLEPPALEIGDTAWVDVAVITPPGWKVPPMPVPGDVPGLWILDAERPATTRGGGRSVHHTRLRVRARATGQFSWPGTTLTLTRPDGSHEELAVPERPFEVRSVLGEHPEQRTFFSYLAPQAEAEGTGPWLPALAGAGLALAGMGLVALVRRVRRAAAPAGPAPSPTAPWRGTQATLAAAEEIAASDPVRAADMASAALRLYVDRRFGARTLTATTEELAGRQAPFALTTRWEGLVGLLAELDAVRFAPPREEDAEHLRATLDRAREFVIAASPQGNWR